MSYILDALKRAQDERELGQVPAMQGALRESATQGERGGASPAGWRWATAALVLLLAAGALWVWQRGPGAPAATAVRMPVSAATPAVATAAPDAPRAAPAGDAAPVSAAPPVLPPVLPAAAPPPAAPPPTPPSETLPSPARANPSTAASASTPPPVVALESLDAPTRARLPRLSLGGTIHAHERAQRMVILDGQVLREGDTVVAGVTVDTIDNQGVLLRLDERFGPPRRVRLRP